MDVRLILLTILVLGGVALLAGVVLYLAAKKFAVFEDPLIGEVESLLPGANCGGCGFAGCHAFAEKVAETKDPELFCPVGGPSLAARIAGALGQEALATQRNVARVLCNGGGNAVTSGIYQGIPSCAAVAIAGTSTLVCPFGCLGLADCVRACPFDALHMVDGVARVDEEACTGCGKCVKACPRGLIEMAPHAQAVYVACKSTDPGAVVRKYCSVGCIGCKACERVCTFSAVSVDQGLASIQPDLCEACMKCVEACKPATIRLTRAPEAKEAAHA
ncbi:MAG: Electron transport complex protein rnfB [Acidobacteria bacterium ADurb.Bin340]|nr:MAG: Electron transport complex protein rnfB [Acidobacteria bacterium ADurb.Bin340]